MEKVYCVIYNDDVLFTNRFSLCETLDEAKKIRAQHLDDKSSSFNKFVPIEVVYDEKRLTELVKRCLVQELIAGHNDEISLCCDICEYVRLKRIGHEAVQKKYCKLFAQDKYDRKGYYDYKNDWEFFIIHNGFGIHRKIHIEGIHGWDYGAGTPEDGVEGESDFSVMDAYKNTVHDIERIKDKELQSQARLALDNAMYEYLK